MKMKDHMLVTWTQGEIASVTDANAQATAGDMLPRSDRVGAIEGDDLKSDGGPAPSWPDDTTF